MISAIILAAGKSARMGQPKMSMPWGETTVLEKVIQTIRAAGIEDHTLVANSNIAELFKPLVSRIIINDGGEMLASVQCGLQALSPPPSLRDTSPKSARLGGGQVEAALICLGDQPQVEEGSVRSVCDAFQRSRSKLVVPSHQMRRGHPWLIERELWDEVLRLREPDTLREFLNLHAGEIEYVVVDTPTILQDLDTPEDYLKYKPRD